MPRKERQQRQSLTEQTEIRQEIIAHILGERLTKRKDRKSEPSPSIELLLKALRIAGSTQRLAEWIQTPVPALNGETPYALMQSEEGRKQVDAVLSRIEYGVY